MRHGRSIAHAAWGVLGRFWEGWGMSKKPPPARDDPAYRRTCTRCGEVRDWVEPVCVCGNPEFSLPKETRRDGEDAPQDMAEA
jgi:hypothetical protein